MEASIKDVARRAGVSISTVSRIMNNSAAVSEKKVQAVKEAMEYYNYEPNQFARGLKKQTSQMIGIYFPSERTSMFEYSYNLELLRGIEKVLEYQNYTMVLIGESREYENQQKRTPKYMEFIKQKKIDGLLLSGLSDKAIKDKVFRQIVEEEYPVVYIGKKVHSNGLNVYAQFEQYTFEMIRTLRDCGHKNILLYMAQIHAYYTDSIRTRVLEKLPDVNLFIYMLDPHSSIREQMHQSIQNHVVKKGCTAVCSRAMEDTQILLSVCAELQIRVPEQISVLSVEHRKDAGQLLYPQISAFYVPAQDMGASAARLLIDYIENRENNDDSIEYDTYYIERDSIRRL